MDAADFLAQLKRQSFFAGQIVHVRELAERPPVFGELAAGLHPGVAAALGELGIHQLYAHQVAAIEHLRGGRSVVVVTGTASGKTLCYTVPLLETLLAEPSATALCLFPTKALTQDQLRGLSRFTGWI